MASDPDNLPIALIADYYYNKQPETSEVTKQKALDLMKERRPQSAVLRQLADSIPDQRLPAI
jgi:hypothetical protein